MLSKNKSTYYIEIRILWSVIVHRNYVMFEILRYIRIPISIVCFNVFTASHPPSENSLLLFSYAYYSGRNIREWPRVNHCQWGTYTRRVHTYHFADMYRNTLFAQMRHFSTDDYIGLCSKLTNSIHDVFAPLFRLSRKQITHQRKLCVPKVALFLDDAMPSTNAPNPYGITNNL